VIVARADAKHPAQVTVRQLQGADPLVRERHLVWFVAGAQGVDSNYEGCLARDLIAELQRPPVSESSRVVLIGKDGGVKWRSARLDLGGVMGLIDTMPMRHWEMQHDH